MFRIAVTRRAISPILLGHALGAALVLGTLLPAPAAARPTGGLSLLLPLGPVLSGDAVLLRGRLGGPHRRGRPVVVTELLPGRRRFTRVAGARTDAQGRWSVVRRAGVVQTSRLVQARAGAAHSRAGVGTASSRVASLAVQAELTLAAPAILQPVGTTIAFAGSLSPRDPGARIELQALAPDGRWLTLRTGRAAGNSRFSIPLGVGEAGQATLRAFFAGDRRAAAAASAPISFIAEQGPLGAVSLVAAPNLVVGSAQPGAPPPTTTLAGTVSGPTGAGRLVTLFARTSGGGDFPPVASTTSDGSGAFSFSAALIRTTSYSVRAADGRLSGQVIVGVLPTVTLVPVPAVAPAGGRVAVAGTVSPPIGGFPAELQRLGRDGGFHTVARGNLAGNGSFRIVAPVGAPGPEQLRVLIAEGSADLVASSAPVTVVVARPVRGAR